MPLLDLETMTVVYYSFFSSVMSYGVDLLKGSSDARRVFFVQRRAV